jgi:predicted Zn-dependent peptidase
MMGTRIGRALLGATLISAAPAVHAAPPKSVPPAKTVAAATSPLLPPLGPARPLNLPHITETTLPNGMRLVVLEDPRRPALWIRLALPAGTVRDPKDKVGLASMVASLLTRGTTTRTEAQIATKIDSLGAGFGAAADADFLTVSANGLSSRAGDLFDLMADVVLHPTFPADEVDRYRVRTVSAIRADLGDPAALAGAALNRLVYGDFGYGNYALGSPQTVAGLTREDAVAFENAYFAPNVATLFLVGDITPDVARKLAVSRFGSWANREVAAPPEAPALPVSSGGAIQPKITILDRPGAAQTQIRIGTRTSGYRDPQRVAGTVATAVLGLGQFDGRLTKEIRVKRGLTYGAGSGFNRKKEAGEFMIETFTKNASTGEVVKIALDETEKLRKTPPPADELRDRKTFLNGSFAVSVASPDNLLYRLTYAVLYGGGPSDLTLYTARTNAVTPEQVRSQLASLDLAPAQVVLVGDAKAIQSQLTGMGPVTVIEPADLDILSPTLTKSPATPPAPVSTTETRAAGQALLQQAVLAHGGDAFLAVKTIQATGKGDLRPPGFGIDVKASAVSLSTMAPDRAFVELTTGFGPVTVGAPGDGKDLWYRFGSVVHDIAAGDLVGDPTSVLREAVAHGYAVQDQGVVDGEGAPSRGMALTDAAGHTTHVYLDPRTHLLSRVESEIGEGAARFDLSDYKTVAGGVNLPTTIVSSLNGKPVLTLTLSSLTLNQPVDTALFARPAD